jgi:uncharacterized protein
MQRARGLLFRPRLASNQALLIPRCASVHTCGMRYPIDIVFLDALGRVLRVVPRLEPWRLAMQAGAAAVLELPPGGARIFGFAVGAQVSALKPLLAGQ